MSGGHLDYNQHILQEIIDQLHTDRGMCLESIRLHTSGLEDETPYEHLCLQEKHDIVQWLGKIIKQMDVLHEQLHKYDYAISGDSCLEDFVKEYLK